MKPIPTLIEDLGQLAELDATLLRTEAKGRRVKELAREIEDTRERLPTAILKHYDLRLARGKPGAARVRGSTCGGCYLSLPKGTLSELRRKVIAPQVCVHCSIFLLPEQGVPDRGAASRGTSEPLAGAEVRKRGRKDTGRPASASRGEIQSAP